MLQYQTGLTPTPPISQGQRDSVLAGLSVATPWSGAGGQNFQDNFSAMAQRNAVDADRAAQMANADYMQKAQALQSQLATRGLGQMAQMQKNQGNLATRRYGQALDMSANLLGGLNGILRGLFS